MREIISYFLYLGLTGFGGPLALVAMMQKGLVEQRQWIDKNEFSLSLGIIKSLPGPVAFMTAVFLGYRRAGFWGGFFAGLCINLPAFLMILILAVFYDSFRSIEIVAQILPGFQSAAIAIIIYSSWVIFKPFLKKKIAWASLLLASGVLGFSLVTETKLILSLVLIFLVYFLWQKKAKFFANHYVPAAVGGVWPIYWDNHQLGELAILSIKAGALVFGTGLAIVPLIQYDVVEIHRWLTHQEFLDAVSFGQITPGPVLLTITFIGYKAAGLSGALLSSVLIFLPSFLHIVTWFPHLVKILVKEKWVPLFAALVTGIVVSGLILVSKDLLLRLDNLQMLVSILGLGALLFLKVPGWLLILASGAVFAIINLFL